MNKQAESKIAEVKEIQLDDKFTSRVNELIQQKQMLETLINENVILFAKMNDVDLDKNKINYHNNKLIVVENK
jgi:hypothetical protein